MRDTLPLKVTLTFAGAPAVAANVTSCPSPIAPGVMWNTTVSPAATPRKLGLKADSSVKTSYVLLDPFVDVGVLSEPPQAIAKNRATEQALSRIGR